MEIGGNPPIWVSHQRICPPTKIQKSVGPYTNHVRAMVYILERPPLRVHSSFHDHEPINVPVIGNVLSSRAGPECGVSPDLLISISQYIYIYIYIYWCPNHKI